MTHREFDAKLLASWLPAQRWYGDKSQTVASIDSELLASVTVVGRTLHLYVVEVHFEGGRESRYFVPLLIETDAVVDALTDADILTWLGRGFAEQRELPLNSGGTMRWLAAGDADWSEQDARLLQGEQSNSSVLFGDRAIVKVFRRLQPGANPDSEIVSFLTNQGVFTHSPRFLGSIIIDRPSAESIEIAATQEFVPNQGDAWRWLPGALAESGGSTRLTDEVALLGTRTGELHAALSVATAPGFTPERITVADIDAIRSRIHGEIAQTLPVLVQQGSLNASDQAGFEQGLRSWMARVDSLVDSMRTRVHGDYHLGQVLRTTDDFIIIDFEGEPSRTMAERRELHSPLKDVAGMLRSIDYAAAAASEMPGADALAIAAWSQATQQAFVEAYQAAIGAAAHLIVPSGPDFESALSLYMIEKVLYEVRYELDNRPDWVKIPFTALSRYATTMGDNGSAK